MAKGKNVQSDLPVVSVLVKSKESVEHLLRKQVDQSKILLSIEVSIISMYRNNNYRVLYPSSEIQYDETQKEYFFNEYQKWDQMNREIFARSFETPNNTSFAEYVQAGDYYPMCDIIEEQKKAIREQVSFIEGFIDRLPIIDCKCPETNIDESSKTQPKRPLLFISHSSKDESIAESLVKLFRTIGFNNTNMFCSSVSGFDIKEGEDIYDTLASKFNDYNIFVIFLLSKNYYDSVACLHEMGASWVLKVNYSTIIAPGFTIPEIEGSINPRKMAVVLDDLKRVKGKLNNLKDRLIEFFSLKEIDDDLIWENDRDEFLGSISNI